MSSFELFQPVMMDVNASLLHAVAVGVLCEQPSTRQHCASPCDGHCLQQRSKRSSLFHWFVCGVMSARPRFVDVRIAISHPVPPCLHSFRQYGAYRITGALSLPGATIARRSCCKKTTTIFLPMSTRSTAASHRSTLRRSPSSSITCMHRRCGSRPEMLPPGSRCRIRCRVRGSTLPARAIPRSRAWSGSRMRRMHADDGVRPRQRMPQYGIRQILFTSAQSRRLRLVRRRKEGLAKRRPVRIAIF